MQNNRQEKSGVYFYDLCIDSGKIWFPDYDTGIVFEYDCAGEGKVNYRRDIYLGKYDKRLYTGIFKNSEWLILAEMYKNLITIINIAEMKCTKINTESLTKGCVSFQSGDVICYEDKIFLFAEMGTVLKYDIKCNVVESIEYPSRLAKRGQIAQKDDKIFIPCLSGNYIYQFDLKLETFSQITLAENIEGIETLCIFDENYWITNQSDRIICWNRSRNQYKYFLYPYDVDNTIYIKNSVQGRAGKKFSKSFLKNGYVWMVPEYSPYIVYVDIKCGKSQIFEIDGEEENEETQMLDGRKNLVKYVAVSASMNNIYLLSSKTENLYEIDTKTHIVRNIKIPISDVQKVIEMTYYEYVPHRQNAGDSRKYLL